MGDSRCKRCQGNVKLGSVQTRARQANEFFVCSLLLCFGVSFALLCRQTAKKLAFCFFFERLKSRLLFAQSKKKCSLLFFREPKINILITQNEKARIQGCPYRLVKNLADRHTLLEVSYPNLKFCF